MFTVIRLKEKIYTIKLLLGKEGIHKVSQSDMKIVKITGSLHKDKLDFDISEWKLLIETNRYYEIKSEEGPVVKRIFKEKMNQIIEESKHYVNGSLTCSVFCTTDHVQDIMKEIKHKLLQTIQTYMHDLQLNIKALDGSAFGIKPQATVKLVEQED